MPIPVVHPWDNIFFFKLAFIPCKNIHYRPDSTRLNAAQLECIKFCFVYLQTVRDLSNVLWYLIADWMDLMSREPWLDEQI